MVKHIKSLQHLGCTFDIYIGMEKPVPIRELGKEPSAHIGGEVEII